MVQCLSPASTADDTVHSLSSDEFQAPADVAVSQHIEMLEAQNMHLHQRAQLLEHILVNTLHEREDKVLRRLPPACGPVWPQPPVLLGRHSFPAGGFRPPPGLAPPSPKSVCTKSFQAAARTELGHLADNSPSCPQFVSPQFLGSGSFPITATLSADSGTDFAPPAGGSTSTLMAKTNDQVSRSAPHPCLDLIHHGNDMCTVVWQIDNVGSKLRTSRGFPLLSPCFALAGLPDLRLMFAPGEEWLDLAGTAKSRRQKQRRTKSGASDDQTFGMVKVKVGNAADVSFRVSVFLGEPRSAAAPSARCDFSTEVVQSCPVEVDWRQHMQNGCLTLRLEFSTDASSCYA